MTPNTEPFVRLGTFNFETVFTVADITLRSTERLVDLQLQTAKEALEQGIRTARAFTDVKDVQDFVALQSKAAHPNLEKALAYSREVYAVATDAQERISRVFKTRISELGGEIMTAVDQAAKSAPTLETASAALPSAPVPAANVRRKTARASSKATPSAPAKRNAKRKSAKKKAR